MQQLNQVLTFTAVAAGGTVALPHNINVAGVPLVPDLLFPDNESFALVSATTTTITVINNGLVAGTLNLWLQLLHTIDRSFGDKATTGQTPRPLWVGGGSGGGSSTDPTQLDLINSEGFFALIPGTPVFSSGAGTVARARANAALTAAVVGLANQVPSIGSGVSGPIKTVGPMTLTTAQWDAVVTGQVGGLTFNAPYFLDPAVGGKLVTPGTNTPTDFDTYIGLAVSPTTLVLGIQPPVAL